MKKLILLAFLGILLLGCSQKQDQSPTAQATIAATAVPSALPTATVDTSSISDVDSQAGQLNELDNLGSDLGTDIPTSDLTN